MDKLFIYGGITIGSLVGAYLPVWLFNASALSVVSIIFGIVGSFVGLWISYLITQNFGE